MGVVFTNGLVVDGSGSDPFVADVTTEGDRIAGVGKRAAGAEELDCSGHAIAPGFIDTHSHSDIAVLARPELPMKVR